MRNIGSLPPNPMLLKAKEEEMAKRSINNAKKQTTKEEVVVGNNVTNSLFTGDLAKRYPFLYEYTTPVKTPEREIIGRKKEMRSLNAAMMRPELCNVILLGEAGSGKALVNDTLIPVADARGYVKIKDIKEGDYVCDQNGKPVKVVGVFPQGKKHAYRVSFSDDSFIDCCDEHLWTVRPANKRHLSNNNYRTKTLRDILDKGVHKDVRSKSGKSYKSKKWYVPKNDAVEWPEAILPIKPYSLGIFIGNGCLTNDVLTISTNNEDVINRVCEEIGSNGHVSNQYNCYFLAENNTKRKYIATSDMADRLPASDIFFKVASKRRIPMAYLKGSIKQRMDLLHGLMDADGGLLNESTVKFMAASPELAEDVIQLARSLGFRASFHVKKNGKRQSYVVYFHVGDDEKPDLFLYSKYKDRLIKGLANKKVKTNVVDLGISDVVDLHKEEEMTCIKVDSMSGLFQAGTCHVVTHNTMLVQGTMVKNTDRSYLEVNLSKMIANLKNENEMADKLKQLFDETAEYRKETGKEIVLFIDEFHQIVQLSPAAVEVLKPLLADSGTRGIRVIAATTFIEFRKWISPNQPLVERLQRININQPDKDMTVAILKGMADRYGVAHQIYGDQLYEAIYEYTNRYIPANSQPRKSILILDSMIGWARAEGRKLDTRLLADVIYESEGVNVAFRVDATKIKEELDKYVLAQSFASTVIEERLQICVADLNDKSKPMSSFLFTGSTGVGKTEMTKQLARILFENDRNLIRFDMTEFANADSLNRFRAELTARVWEHPYSIILFDEIEKACSPVTRILLQVLDDGRLTDENNREVSFTNAYVVLTTNAGSEIYRNISQYNVDDEGSGAIMKKYNKLIRDSISGTTGDNRFPPELLGRIDCIVPFQPLSENTMKDIVRMKLRKLKNELKAKHDVTLKISDKIIQYLIEDNMDTDSNSGGARAVMSKLEQEVTTSISRFINANPEIKTLGVDVEGEMASDNKFKVESDAYVKVFAVEGKRSS